MGANTNPVSIPIPWPSNIPDKVEKLSVKLS